LQDLKNLINIFNL